MQPLGRISSDTVLRVIQPAARRAQGSSPQPLVTNSAAPIDLRPTKVDTGRIALRGSRSDSACLTKTFRLAKAARRKSEAVGLKPFRASKEWAISSASTNPALLVSSPRQQSAGRGLWRGEFANIQRNQRTISHPESSVPPLPNPPHQPGLMEGEKKHRICGGF